MRRRRAYGASLILTLAASLAGPARAQPPADADLRLAVFPLRATRAKPATLLAVEAALTSACAALVGQAPVSGPALAVKVGKRPASMVKKCEQQRKNAACFTSLAARAGVTDLVYGRLERGRGYRLTLVAVGGRNPAGATRSIQLAVPGSLDTPIREMLTALLRLNPDAPAAVAEVVVPPAASPAATVTPSGPVADAGPAEASKLEKEMDPGLSDTAAPAEMITAVALRNGGPLMAVTAERTTPSRSWWMQMLRWGGWAMAAGGAGTLGVGGYYGIEARSLRSDLRRDLGTSYIDAKTTNRSANHAARQANLLFLVGGVVAAAGSGMAVTDWLLQPEPVAIPLMPAVGLCLRDSDCAPGRRCIAGACGEGGQAEPSGFTLTGKVTDRATGLPVANATVTARDGAPTAVDAATGEFRISDLPVSGLIRIMITAPGYQPEEKVVPAGEAGEARGVSMTLSTVNEATTGELHGTVASRNRGKPLAAHVLVMGGGKRLRLEAGSNGEFSSTLEPGDYDVLVWTDGYRTQKKRVRIDAGAVVILNLDLSPEAD